jgi:hypothetical protein
MTDTVHFGRPRSRSVRFNFKRWRGQCDLARVKNPEVAKIFGGAKRRFADINYAEACRGEGGALKKQLILLRNR